MPVFSNGRVQLFLSDHVGNDGVDAALYGYDGGLTGGSEDRALPRAGLGGRSQMNLQSPSCPSLLSSKRKG